MNTNTSPNRGRKASSAAVHGAKDKAYDEERLEWGSVASRCTKWPKKYLRLPRFRKVTLYLLLIDIVIVALLVCAFEPLITLLARNEEMFGARLTFPLDDPAPGKLNSDRQTIPRILHQTVATEVIPDDWVASQQSCKDAYSDFEYKLWTDELARDFIATEYSWFLDTWDNYHFGIQRADAIRYFILHHFGGIYLDMDTLCNETIPLHQLEYNGQLNHAVFKSTKPTGVSNDLLVSSPHHPVFTAAIAKLQFYDSITRPWAKLLPHCAIMISAGPFFLTMVAKSYLLEQPSLPLPSVQVINETELAPYITDLEGCSWHHGDTQTLMYVGDHPWIWFALGAIGLAIGLHIINQGLLIAFKGLDKLPSVTNDSKVAKLT